MDSTNHRSVANDEMFGMIAPPIIDTAIRIYDLRSRLHVFWGVFHVAAFALRGISHGLPIDLHLFGQQTARPAVGDEIANLKFKDIRYLPRSLKDFGEKKALVLIFTNTTCPLVQKYWPKLKRLDEQYRGQGVQFVGINVGPDDEIQESPQQAIDFGVEFPLVKDTNGSCVKALGIERTPEVAVLDGQQRLRYRGRIDDQVRLSGSRPMSCTTI